MSANGIAITAFIVGVIYMVWCVWYWTHDGWEY